MAGQLPTGTGQKAEATQSFFVLVRDNNTGKITSVVIPGDVQIGLDGNPADLTLMGRFSVNATNYNIDLANKGIVQSTSDDTIIGISLVTTPISGKITLYLSQNPREGELHFIKDLTGTSDVVPIEIYPTTGYTIDGMENVVLSDPTASLAVVFLNGNWFRLTAGIGTSGGSGANPDDSFVTVNVEPSLPNSRQIKGSSGVIVSTDGGAGNPIVFDLAQILTTGSIGTYSYATVTTDTYGRVVAISSGVTPPSATDSFITAQPESALPDRRVLSGSKGVLTADGGAGSTFGLSVDPTFFVAQGAISLFTAPNGNLVISGSGGNLAPNSFAPYNAEYLLLALTSSLPDARLISPGTGISYIDGGPQNTFTISINNNIVATLSGSTFSGPIKAPSITASLGFIAQGTGPGGGFSGSLQLLADGHTPYLVGGSGVTVSTSSNGQVVVTVAGTTVSSITGSGGSNVTSVGGAYTVSSSVGADRYASYLLASASAADPNARVLAPGTGVTLVDTGPGGTLTINATATGGSTGGPWTDNGQGIYTTSSVAIDPRGHPASVDGVDTWFYVSGTIGLSSASARRSVFGGDVNVSGSLTLMGTGSVFSLGFTGSLTKTTQGNPYMVGVGQVNVSTNSLGQVIVSSLSSSLTGPNAWIDDGGTVRTTSSVAISDSTEDGTVLARGTDIYFYVSGTVATATTAPSPSKSLLGGDVVISGSLKVLGALGITGSITQLPAGNPYIIGYGGTSILTNSLGQIVVSSSQGGGGGGGSSGINVDNQGTTLPANPYTVMNFVGAGVTAFDVGGVATISIPGSTGASIPGAFAIYSGYTTASVWWSNTGSMSGFTNALNGGQFVDTTTLNITRNGSNFTFLQTGFYRFLADFNAYGNDAYITLQLSGTGGDLLNRSTYRSTPTDQSLMILDGIFKANAGDTYTLQYTTSGTTYPWSGSNPVPGGDNMRTGEINIFLVPSGSTVTNTYNITASAGSGFVQANYAVSSDASLFNINTAGFNPVPGLTTTITSSGSPILVMVQANWVAQTNDAQSAMSLFRNGTNLGDSTNGMIVCGPRAQSWNLNASLFYVDFAVAGSHTYTYEASALAGTGLLTAYGVGPATIMAWEMKNANVVTSSTTTATVINGGYTPIIGLSASIIPTRNPVLVMALVDPKATNVNDWSAVDIFRNGVEFGNSTQGMQLNDMSTAGEFQPSILSYLDTGPTFGSSNQYVVKARLGAGTSHTYGASNTVQTLMVWELTDINWKFVQTTNTINTGGSYTDMIGTIPSPEISTRGRPVLAISNFNNNPNSGNGRAAYSFFRNGSNLATGSAGMQLLDGETNSGYNAGTSLMLIDPVNAGSWTYQLMGLTYSGSGGQVGGTSMPTTLFLYELDAGSIGGITYGGWLDEGNLLFTTASIQVIGNSNIGGFQNIVGNQQVGGNSAITGNLNVGGALNVGGVGGTSFFDGNLTVLGTLIFSSGSSGLPITGSAVSRRQTLNFLSAMVTTPQYSGSKGNLGVAYFDPTKFNTSVDAIKFYYRGIFAPVNVLGNAYIDLYDYSGIVTGVPGPVSGSVLTSSIASTLTNQSVDLSNIFSAVTGSGILLARAWADPSGSNFVNVGGVRMDFEWQ